MGRGGGRQVGVGAGRGGGVPWGKEDGANPVGGRARPPGGAILGGPGILLAGGPAHGIHVGVGSCSLVNSITEQVYGYCGWWSALLHLSWSRVYLG